MCGLFRGGTVLYPRAVRLAMSMLACLPALLGWVLADLQPDWAMSWWPYATVSLVTVATIWALRRGPWHLLALAATLATLGGHHSAQAQRSFAALRSPIVIDLAAGQTMPEPPPPYVVVRGYYRSAWTLDEYAVAAGELPNQSTQAKAVLVPFVGAPADVIELEGAIVVARVGPRVSIDQNGPQNGPQTIRGKVEPLAPALQRTLVQIAGSNQAAPGYVVDTLSRPTATEAWTKLLLVVVVNLLGVACLWFATLVVDNRSPGT